MDMLLFPMLINLMLYYFFFVSGFGYMAIVLFLSSLFIVPTMDKCKAEITEKRSMKLSVIIVNYNVKYS